MLSSNQDLIQSILYWRSHISKFYSITGRNEIKNNTDHFGKVS